MYIKAYFITNDEPIPFWDMPKKLWKGLNCPQPIIYLPLFLMTIVFWTLDRVMKLLGKEPMFWQMLINSTTTKTFNISKAKRDLSYRPKYTLDEGIKKSLEYFKKEIDEGRFKA